MVSFGEWWPGLAATSFAVWTQADRNMREDIGSCRTYPASNRVTCGNGAAGGGLSGTGEPYLG